MKLIDLVHRLWIKCLTDKRYTRVTEGVVWSFVGIVLGVVFLGVIPQPTFAEIP